VRIIKLTARSADREAPGCRDRVDADQHARPAGTGRTRTSTPAAATDAPLPATFLCRLLLAAVTGMCARRRIRAGCLGSSAADEPAAEHSHSGSAFAAGPSTSATAEGLADVTASSRCAWPALLQPPQTASRRGHSRVSSA
jgi:hypothetical protein